MRSINRYVIATGVLLALANGSSVRAAAPAKPEKGPASPVPAAVAALLKEYQTVMKDKKGEGLREKCNYFAETKTQGLTPELILAALERPIGSDPRAEAYVKWQLLSGVESKFPDALTARAIKAYRAAPLPRAHPGIERAKLERALYRVGINNAEAEVPVNKDMNDAITAYRTQIEPILEYRDEFYSRLAPGFDTLVAGLSDVYDRVSHGAPTNTFWTTVSAAVRSWALTAGDAAQLQQLAGAVGKLHEYVKDDRNKPYFRVMWVKEDKYTGLRWMGEPTIQNDKIMEELGDWLTEHAKNPSGGALNFKTPDDKKMKK